MRDKMTAFPAVILAASVIVCLAFGPGRTAHAAGDDEKRVALLPLELEPYYLKWFQRPGEMLSVLDNASDLASSGRRVGANATYAVPNLPLRPCPDAPEGVVVDTSVRHLRDMLTFAEEHGYLSDVSLGERNNPFFTNYPREFVERNLDSYMRDVHGDLIILDADDPFDERARLVPAVCDSVITRLASRYIREGVGRVRHFDAVRTWVIGSEEQYPDYFGVLPVGDFRPAFVKQFREWLGVRGWALPHEDFTPVLAEELNPLQAAWFMFREQAMADRAAGFYVDFLVADQGEQPVVFPTHGNPFAGRKRRGLGLAPGLKAGACDGFEMGHISIDDDEESLNLLFTAALTAYGVPVTAPRLGNKTLDPEARGGGRTFTPFMLRRLVYECLGMGVNHIGPIHWRASLHDGEWFIKDTPTEPELARVFREIQNVYPYLAGMGRLQPRVGLLVSDDTWLDGWDPRWTGFFQEAVKHHWHMTIVGDAMVNSELAGRIPVLISLDNRLLGEGARRGIEAYLDAGGLVVAWRALGVYDALGQPDDTEWAERVRAHKGCVTIPAALEGEERTLANRFQTSHGAWTMPHRFTPAPFEHIGAAIDASGASTSLRAFDVKGVSAAGDVTVLPLTDGVSVLAVVVNNTDTPEQLELAPTVSALPGRAWTVYDVLDEREMLMADGGQAIVGLEGHGTRLVWFAPDVTPARVADAVTQANAALGLWAELGVQLDFLQVHRDALHDAPLHGPRGLKSYCLAERVRGALGIVPAAVETDAGAVRVEARVYDANGREVADADVRVRLTPDRYAWRTLRNEGGTFTALIAPKDAGPFFDPARGVYTHDAEARRVVFTATRDGASGGAGLVLSSAGKP